MEQLKSGSNRGQNWIMQRSQNVAVLEKVIMKERVSRTFQRQGARFVVWLQCADVEFVNIFLLMGNTYCFQIMVMIQKSLWFFVVEWRN